MGLTIPTLPTGSEVENKRKRSQPVSKHGPLHMMEGLSCCWCMCGSCWAPEGYTNQDSKKPGVAKGQCICRECPCRKGKGFLEQ